MTQHYAYQLILFPNDPSFIGLWIIALYPILIKTTNHYIFVYLVTVDIEFLSLMHISIDLINDADPFIQHALINSAIEIAKCVSDNGDQ